MIILPVYSCKKNVPAINPQVIGTWSWLHTGIGNTILADQNSGIQKTLLFNIDGTISITHNDSAANYAELQVNADYVLMANSITNTSTYQFTSQPNPPCDPYKLPVLPVKDFGSYQYKILGDTLQISGSPCLAPVVTTYVRHI